MYGSVVSKDWIICVFTSSRNSYVYLAFSPNSSLKADVISVENKARAGETFWLSKFVG